MYAFVDGILQATDPVVIDVGGLGFELNVGERQRLALPPVGDPVRLFTHLVVREDDMSLYGFSTLEEREVFRALLGVSGVGPKVALGIVGSEQVDDVLHGIRRGDPKPLLAVKGIGRKTAERVVLELEDKAAAWVDLGDGETTPAAEVSGALEGPAAEAVLALQTLGVAPDRAAGAVASVLVDGPVVSVEELLRAALRHLHPEQRGQAGSGGAVQ